MEDKWIAIEPDSDVALAAKRNGGWCVRTYGR